MVTDVLTMYTATICQPCRTAKSRLTQAGIAYEEINIEEDAETLERLKKSMDVQKITTPLFRWRGQLRQIDALTEIINAHKESA